MDLKEIYPLKFYPQYYEKIWGGEELRRFIGANEVPDNCGEAWLLSCVDGKTSVIANGYYKDYRFDDLIEEKGEQLLGREIYKKYKSFPLLIKLIDAADKLSVQVHPDDEIARLRHGSYGKNEMWYIINSDNDSWLVLGFNEIITKDDYIRFVNNGELTDKMNKVKISNDDVYYIPAGLVHAIGNNILLAEIQQSSDITYRIFDWNRRGDDGKLRELHTEQAIDAIKYFEPIDCKIDYDKRVKNKGITLVNNKFFITNRLFIDSEYVRYKENSFIIYLCIGGKGKIVVDTNEESLKTGELVFIPAVSDSVKICPRSEMILLEVTL